MLSSRRSQVALAILAIGLLGLPTIIMLKRAANAYGVTAIDFYYNLINMLIMSETIDGGGAAASSSANAPLQQLLQGTLSYHKELRRHIIRGMWNYEHSKDFPPQRFELFRNLDPDEDVKVVPKDGEFCGSFSLAFITTSKGQKKEISKVLPECGVKIKFTPVPNGEDREYKVDGRGVNQLGNFIIYGTATRIPPQEGDTVFSIVLTKSYEPSAPPPATETAATLIPTEETSSIMEKCSQILRFVREKDVSRGGYFSRPVHQIALSIPTYLDVIPEPMDLGTIHRRMEANEVTEPEEFSRLVRLVFENAMTFYEDPKHPVHRAARDLLFQFNQKHRDVDRLLQNSQKYPKPCE